VISILLVGTAAELETAVVTSTRTNSRIEDIAVVRLIDEIELYLGYNLVSILCWRG
jgi:hypothetical protein